MPNFVESLAAIKRKARLSGRTVSSKEVAGLTAGFADTASLRLSRQKALGLEEEKLGLSREEVTQRATLQTQSEAASLQRAELAETSASARQAKELAARKETETAQIRVADEARRDEEVRGAVVGTVGGASAGGFLAAGTALGGPIGAIIGALIGFGASKLCIIVTSCTSEESYEVKLCRTYRDKKLEDDFNYGYYVIARILVSPLKKSLILRKIVKRILIDRLVDFGEYELGLKNKMMYKTSKFISNSFLNVCKTVGRGVIKHGKPIFHS